MELIELQWTAILALTGAVLVMFYPLVQHYKRLEHARKQAQYQMMTRLIQAGLLEQFVKGKSK